MTRGKARNTMVQWYEGNKLRKVGNVLFLANDHHVAKQVAPSHTKQMCAFSMYFVRSVFCDKDKDINIYALRGELNIILL